MSQKQTSIPLPSTAPEPFDNVDADVVLRSSDNVDFRVFKIILSLASLVFKDMFTLPQPDSQPPTSPSVIPVSESSAILAALLSLCYPGTTPTFNSFKEARAVADAAVKYDMSPVMQHLKDLIASCYVESSPLPLYALCCRLGWKELAERAARQTLKIKDLGRPSLYIEEMEEMTAGSYHRLLAFHFACGEAAAGVGKSDKWIPTNFQHGCCKCGSYVISHIPVQHYLTETSCELLLRPDPSTLLNTGSAFKNAFKTITTSGARCGPDGVTFMIDRIEHLRCIYVAQIEKVLLKVQLEFKS
ncbi:hypothetical protein BU15DRAFT_73831 [Melanogaster broomeanus]|nr:hypothetical protein BU15DRAFT_73831 [Melanogaster broomeanus]